MRIFITGVSGFVGSGLVNYFQQYHDINLFGYSRNIEAAKDKFRDLKLTMVPDCSWKTFDDFGIDCVIQLAGVAHDLGGRYKAEDYYRVNFQDSVSLYEEFVKSKASKFIFLSSIKAAVDSSDYPVTEEVAAQPISDYGKSKLMAEKHMRLQELPQSKRLYIFRPAMIHGRGNKGNLTSLYKYVRSGMPYIFGSYQNKRSFLSAENLHFVLHRFLVNDYPSGIYNIADTLPLSTNELVAIISSGTGKEPRIWHLPQSVIDPFVMLTSWIGLPLNNIKQKLTESLVVSNSKLIEVLKEPLPIDSKSGLLSTIRSFNEQ